MRIYKKSVKIKGYGDFEKICNFDKKHKVFEIKYPEHVISSDIVQLRDVYDSSLKEVEEKWAEKVRMFEASYYDYKTVIVYQLEENGSYRDGSGTGLLFNWGVFRKLKPSEGYFFTKEQLDKVIYDAHRDGEVIGSSQNYTEKMAERLRQKYLNQLFTNE